MSLWAFIPAKHIEKVGALPLVANRLDTGELVTDLPGANIEWARACGWWDLDNVDIALLVETNDLTSAELDVLIVEGTAAVQNRNLRRQWVDDIKQAWAIAKSALADHLGDPPIPTPPPVGNVSQSLIYLYGRVQNTDRILYGGGTVQTPGVADALITVTEVLLEVIEQSDGLELET